MYIYVDQSSHVSDGLGLSWCYYHHGGLILPLFPKNMFCLLRKNVLQFKKCKARKPTLETWKNNVLHEVQKNPGSEHMSAFYGSASFRYWRRWWMWRRRRWLILPQAHLQELDTRPNTTKGWWILGQDPQPDQMATLEWVAICVGQLWQEVRIFISIICLKVK